MILSPHIITGAALGANFHHPYLLPLSAIALHHLLDKIPHYDYQIKPFSSRVALKVFADISIGLLIVAIIYLFINSNINLMYTAMGMLFGTLPDGILLVSFIFNNNILIKYQKFHSFIHGHDKESDKELNKNLTLKELLKKRFFWLGIITQIIVVIIALNFLA